MDHLNDNLDNLSTPRKQKTQETKDKIYNAAVAIMRKYGYNYLSVKNICQAAGVSNGTFFYHFQTKDKLLSYYLEDQFATYREKVGFDASNLPHKEQLLKYYKCYSDYVVQSGVDFIAEYYSPKNKALNTRATRKAVPNASELSFSFTTQCMQSAYEANELRENLNPLDCTNNCCTILKGIIFDWILSDGKLNMYPLIDDMIGGYLSSVLK